MPPDLATPTPPHTPQPWFAVREEKEDGARGPWSKGTADGGGVEQIGEHRGHPHEAHHPSIMAEATIGGWRTSTGENYPDPHPSEIVVFEDFISMDLGILAIPFCESYVTIIGLASAISTPTLFLLYPLYYPL
jgi:hypothetical protein